MRPAKKPRPFAHGFEPRLLHPVGERRPNPCEGVVRKRFHGLAATLPENFEDGVAHEPFEKHRFVGAADIPSGAPFEEFSTERILREPSARTVWDPAKETCVEPRRRRAAFANRKENVLRLPCPTRGIPVGNSASGERKAQKRLVPSPDTAVRLDREVRETVFPVGQGREKDDRLPALPMPTSCDRVERESEDPRVQTTQGRQSRLQSEEKKPAAVRKRYVPQIGQILHEGGPGKKRGKKMRFKERAVGRGEKHPLQRLAVPREDRHRIDGRPDGTPPVVKESGVSRRVFA